mgnify:FL=1
MEIGLTAIKIKVVYENKKLNDRQRFREVKKILTEFESDKLASKERTISILNDEVKDFRTIKRLLK